MKTILIDGGISVEYYTAAQFKEVATPEIISQITKATSSGFGSSRDEEDMRCHIFDAQNIGVVRKYGALAGFATTQNFPELSVCYLHGIAIGLTGGGLGSILLQRMLLESGMTKFGFTTQNPAMYIAAKRCTITIFPNPEDTPEPGIFEIGERLVAHRKGYMLDTMAIMELYPECLYPSLPIPKDEYLWVWWQKMLRINPEGKTRDGIVFVGKIK